MRKNRFPKFLGNVAKAFIGELPIVGSVVKEYETELPDSPKGSIHWERLIYRVVFGGMVVLLMVKGVASCESMIEFLEKLI